MASLSEPEAKYRSLINKIAPELDIRKLEINAEGMANDVVIVNSEFVFRFAKGELGHSSYFREIRALEVLRGHVEIPIPVPFYTAEDVIAYHFLPGESFTRDKLAALNLDDQKTAAGHLAAFLRGMHAINDPDLPLTAAPVRIEQFQEQYRRAREVLFPLLLPHQVDWVQRVYSFIDLPGAFDVEPTLSHGDLAPYHILFNPQHKRLSGVIDFGVSGLGDPASDLGALLQYYGPEFVSQMAEMYPGIDRYLPRASFYAQAIEIQWVLLGLDRGENFWFTAHLGGWRGLDIGKQ